MCRPTLNRQELWQLYRGREVTGVRELERGRLQFHPRPSQEGKQLKTNNVGGKDMLHKNQELREIHVSL